MPAPIRNIRFIGYTSQYLNKSSNASGDLFYDITAKTIRVMDGQQIGGFALARGDLTNVANSTVSSKVLASGALTWNNVTGKPTFSAVATTGNYNDLSNKPASVDLTGYATEAYVTAALSAFTPQEQGPTFNFSIGADDSTLRSINSGESVKFIGAGSVTTSSDTEGNITITGTTNLTGYATESYVTTAISNLVDAAPTTLNTLNELSAALGDDANYATTISSALGLKAPTDSPTFTGTVSGITKSMVGLGNVDNTSDSSKPISTLVQNALNDKANSASPTFTGTVSGITAAMVGLGNVTNESKATMFANSAFTGTTTFAAIGSSINVFSDVDTVTTPPSTGQVLKWNGTNWVPALDATAGGGGLDAATLNGQAGTYYLNYLNFTNTPPITATAVGLGNVTNESKATMFASPTFTGTVSGVTATMVGLGNVTNESKATMFASPTFTGTVSGVTATHVGLGNVTNESKATMFASPTFTGTVSGVTATMVGLGNVTNESKATMFASPTFTGTVSGVTATHVGLGDVTNESKATMFASPTFTGTVSGVTATAVGLGNVTNESKATMFTSPTFTGTVTQQQSTEVSTTKTGATGVVIHDYTTGAIFVHSSISANFTANFTNIPTTNDRTLVITLVLNQGVTAFACTGVQIDGGIAAVNWLGGSTPTGSANKRDVQSFILIRSSNNWTVLSSLASYG